MISRVRTIVSAGVFAALVVAVLGSPAAAQELGAAVKDKWVTVTEAAAGTNLAAKDQAVTAALRKAVQEACGTFLSSKAKVQNYKLIYSKVFETTVGYVKEHKVVRTWPREEITYVQVRALVSTGAFEKKWASIAHTIDQENNPRCIIAIGENVQAWPRGSVTEVKEAGIVQTKLEDFLLTKGVKVMDRGTTKKVSKRDILLASLKGNTAEIAALGGRFKADVFILGNCTAKFGRTIQVAGQTLYQHTATLKVRAIRADSSELLVSKTFGPVSTNTLQRLGGQDKAMAKLAEDAAPKVLKAVVEAWRKQISVRRTIQLQIIGLKYKRWKVFREEAGGLRGVQALRLREITEGVALIDVEYSYTIQNLADRLTEMKKIKLEVDEISANRVKLKVVEK